MRKSYERLLKQVGISFTVFMSLLGIVGGFSYFGYPLLQGSGVLGIMVIVLISIIAGLVYIIMQNPERMLKGLGSTDILSKTVIKQIESCIDKGEFRSAIVLARAMSRPLWLEGKYEKRLRLGELLQKAASSLHPPELSALTQALIDELGWTNVELNNLKAAAKNINEGIQYAKQMNDVYMIARGYRHLSGVAQKEGDQEMGAEYLNLAEKEASKINDKKRQKEMLAGISFGRGDLCLMTNEKAKTEEARDHFLTAKNIQEELGDRERLVKTNMRLGQTYQRLRESGKAIEFYNQSLRGAKELAWLQQICEIDIHMGRLMLEEGRLPDAHVALEEAKTIAENINLENLCDEATELLNKTQAKTKHALR